MPRWGRKRRIRQCYRLIRRKRSSSPSASIHCCRWTIASILAYPQERPGGCCSAREPHPVEPTRPRGLRQPSIVSSWRPARPPLRSPTARAISPPDRGTANGEYPRLAPATVVSYRCLWRVRDRFCANYPLNYANNERSSSQPHSPVGRAVHAGRCGSHDRLGHRRRAERSSAASASARITEMMRGCRHEGCAAQTSALQRASD
jgi:hypothetical protein